MNSKWLCLFLAGVALAQTPPPPRAGSPDEVAPETEPGISVQDPLVVSKCGSCHQKDEKNNLTRISWERTTPEGWQQIVKRMVRLNGVSLTPDEARRIVKSLSDTHGLAPEEARPVAYYAEERQVDEKFDNDQHRQACAGCHVIARPKSWRRSKREWQLLVNMHLGLYPTAEYTSFRRGFFRADAPPEKDPVDVALEYMQTSLPLHSAEWAQWSASMRPASLEGSWLVSGYQPGHGKVFGELTIRKGAEADTFVTSMQLNWLASGKSMTREGKAIVYTGYAWRGRSTSSADPKEMREVMMLSRDQNSIEGRWFWGGYNEFGIDVKISRLGATPSLFTDLTSLRTGSSNARVAILGAIPTGTKASDISLGSGIVVKRVVTQSERRVEIEVDVEESARPGTRDVFIRNAHGPSALAVYDKVDYITVNVESAMARLGGQTHPKGLFQFEAIGWNRGLDGKTKTADDVSLGPVKASWSVEEFLSTYGDDDKEFVGTLSAEGLFTPAAEGPNPQRKWSRNNFGDVWVVATHNPEQTDGKKSTTLSAKSYLVVTIPLYIRWEQEEVGQ